MRRHAFVLLALVVALAACSRRRGGFSRCARQHVTKGQCVRTPIEEFHADDPMRVRVKFSYLWQGSEPTPAHEIEWTIPRIRLSAVHDTSRERIKCERVAGVDPTCPVSLRPEASARAMPTSPSIAEREKICPPNAALNQNIALIDDNAFEDLFESSQDARWQRTNIQRAGIADALYVHDQRRIRVSAVDMIHACTGDHGSTEMLLDTEGVESSQVSHTRLTAQAIVAPAVIVRLPRSGPDRLRLVMWFGDRCRVVVEPLDANVHDGDLTTVAKALDVLALEALCAKR